jgi:hypothetical protein
MVVCLDKKIKELNLRVGEFKRDFMTSRCVWGE